MTQRIALVFPGQGSQSVGMMQSLYNQYETVRQTYAEANEVLGFDLWQMTAEGPAESLNETINTQPAMLTAGVAAYRALNETFAISPQLLAGHSLGEYTALVASGQLTFAEALRLARKRAECMQAAVPQGQGAMAAILGLEITHIRQVCEDISNANKEANQQINQGANQGVWAANDNAPGQTVIAGHATAVAQACEALKQAGAKRALALPVSVPSHCPLMASAAEAMKSAFLMATWTPAKVPVVHNVDVAIHANTADIISALSKQLIAPVRWVETVQYFADEQIDLVVEVGPGKVLAGLNKRINKEMPAFCVHDQETLESLADLLK